MDIEEDN